MPGVGPGGTGNTKRDNPNLEKMDQYVDMKVQIIFSSISYTKFLKQKARSTTFVTNKKGGTASDYFLYCAEDWPEKAYLYNDPVDQVIFIDCGSDDFGSATANGKNETVLRKYISFAIMRLKDMLYRRSEMYHQRGQVHCMILSIFPFHKCMLAMSALLGKMLSDSDIYVSFIADVVSRPEYRYTFNWIRSYGWSIDVFYNAALSPYKGSVRCTKSPKMKLDDIDKLLHASTRYGLIGVSKMPPEDLWVNKKYSKDEEGDVTLPWGEKQAGSKKKITFYNKKEEKTTTYDGEEITVTNWVPENNETEVWVPSDPNVNKWKDPETGKLLVRLDGQIYERDYLYDYWEQAVHPTNDQLKQRIGEAHQKYDEAKKRADDTFNRALAAQEEGDSQFTEQFVNQEVENLVKNSNLTREEAKTALAEQGFIPKNKEGETMYFTDGRFMTNDGLVDMVKAAGDADIKALKDWLDAQKALEDKKNSDILFCLNAASLVVGVVSFGATGVIAAGVFALVDISLNVSIVCFQIRDTIGDGKGVMDAFGSSTGERVFNIAVTGIAIVADAFSFVPAYKGIKGIITRVQKPPKNSFHSFIDEASAEFDSFFDSKIGAQPKPNNQIEIKGVDVNTGISLNGEKIHEHAFEITQKGTPPQPTASPQPLPPNRGVNIHGPKGSGENIHIEYHQDGQIKSVVHSKDGHNTQTLYYDENGRLDAAYMDTSPNTSSGAKGKGQEGANPDSAETPMVQQDKAAQDVAVEGNGNVSSNTGNADLLTEAIFNNIGWGPLRGTLENGIFSKDFAKLVAALDHWICIGVVIKGAIDAASSQQDFSEEDHDLLKTEKYVDTPNQDLDTFESINTELDDMNQGDIGNLVGVDPNSLDAQAIADDTQQSMDSMRKLYDTDDDMYQDYAQMNAVANNAVAANEKVKAAEEYVETGKQMGEIVDEIGLDNPETIVDIAKAEAQGAQVDLLLQQIIQKDKDNKMIDDE